MRKIFLLGIGCQKGGTSWLHTYLSAHPQVDLGFAKEYHVFDYLFIEDQKISFNVLKSHPDIRKSGSDAQRKLAFCEDVSLYFEYFAQLAAHERVRVTGDITPAYAGLSRDVFELIRSNLSSRGLAAKVVFLLRDPVERAWSVVRMGRRRGKSLHRSMTETFEDYYLRPSCEYRTRYDITMQNVLSVFDETDVFVELYETLFDDKATRTLTDFLGISPLVADFGLRVNASPPDASLPEELQARAALHYADVYRMAAARFGTERIRSAWPSARYVL